MATPVREFHASCANPTRENHPVPQKSFVSREKSIGTGGAKVNLVELIPP
jgi:hypothetical protein